MTFVSVTGMALIFFLAKRRTSGLMAAAIGAVLCYVVYLVWVPWAATLSEVIKPFPFHSTRSTPAGSGPSQVRLTSGGRDDH